MALKYGSGSLVLSAGKISSGSSKFLTLTRILTTRMIKCGTLGSFLRCLLQLVKVTFTLTVKKRTWRKKPGFACWASNAALCFLVWFDKRPVHMLSNAYQPHDPTSTVTHWYTTRRREAGYHGKVQKLINLPHSSNGVASSWAQLTTLISTERTSNLSSEPANFGTRCSCS